MTSCTQRDKECAYQRRRAPGSGPRASLTHLQSSSLSPFPSTNELEATKVFLSFLLHLYLRNSPENLLVVYLHVVLPDKTQGSQLNWNFR